VCAKRKRGMPAIPNALSQGKDVFPITPFRQVLAIATFGTNDGEVIDLDLQFEDNEVLDVWSMQTQVNFAFDTAPDAVATGLWHVALFEDPDKADATDLSVAATIEDDSSLIHIEEGRAMMLFTTAAGFQALAADNAINRYFQFPQPYTVARNLKVIMQIAGTQADIEAMRAVVTVWGRRRNATDAEFKNIIYRQRF